MGASYVNHVQRLARRQGLALRRERRWPPGLPAVYWVVDPEHNWLVASSPMTIESCDFWLRSPWPTAGGD